MKDYTMWRMDDSEWLLEVMDEVLGDKVKHALEKGSPKIKAVRFAVGNNTPLRMFKVKTEDIGLMEKFLNS